MSDFKRKATSLLSKCSWTLRHEYAQSPWRRPCSCRGSDTDVPHTGALTSEDLEAATDYSDLSSKGERNASLPSLICLTKPNLPKQEHNCFLSSHWSFINQREWNSFRRKAESPISHLEHKATVYQQLSFPQAPFIFPQNNLHLQLSTHSLPSLTKPALKHLPTVLWVSHVPSCPYVLYAFFF